MAKRDRYREAIKDLLMKNGRMTFDEILRKINDYPNVNCTSANLKGIIGRTKGVKKGPKVQVETILRTAKVQTWEIDTDSQ